MSVFSEWERGVDEDRTGRKMGPNLASGCKKCVHEKMASLTCVTSVTEDHFERARRRWVQLASSARLVGCEACRAAGEKSIGALQREAAHLRSGTATVTRIAQGILSKLAADGRGTSYEGRLCSAVSYGLPSYVAPSVPSQLTVEIPGNACHRCRPRANVLSNKLNSTYRLGSSSLALLTPNNP